MFGSINSYHSIPLLWGKFSYIELKYYIGMSFRVHVSLARGSFHLQFLLGYLGTSHMVSEPEWQHSGKFWAQYKVGKHEHV